MLSERNKISIRQMFFILITITFSPSIRWAPIFGAYHAKQAIWLAPIVSIVFMYVLISMFNIIYSKYKSSSLMDFIENVLGIVLSKTIMLFYVIWITMLVSLYMRYYSERLVSTIMSNTSIEVFIIITLIGMAFVLRSGIVVIARMNQVFLPIIVIVFYILVALTLPKVEIKSLTPISSLDIFPIIKGSFVITVIWQYFIILLFFSDQINNKENFKKEGIKAIVFLVISTMSLLIVIIGILGHKLTKNMPLPFYEVITQISLFNTIERIESLVVALWIFADFILISAFIYSILHIIKWFFKLKDTKFMINPLLIIVFFTTMMLTSNRFELELYSRTLLVPINFVFQFIIPVAIFIIGKIRRKV